MEIHAELTSALADLEKTRVRLEQLRQWAQSQMAKDNTRFARLLLEKTVPEELRETAPVACGTEAVQAGRCFREVTAILNRGIK